MAEKNNIQKYIQTYIQENQGVYTRDAITQKLIDGGYTVHDIDVAYETLGIGVEFEPIPPSELDENKQEYLQKYVRANSDFSRFAVEKKLLEAGYSTRDVDRAYHVLGLDSLDDYHDGVDWHWREASVSPCAFLIFFPIIPILALICYSIVAPSNIVSDFGFGIFLYIIVFLAGIFLILYVKGRDPGSAKGMLYGFIVSLVILPIVAVFILYILFRNVEL